MVGEIQLKSGFAREGDAVTGEEADAALEPQSHAKRIDLLGRKTSPSDENIHVNALGIHFAHDHRLFH